MRHNLKEIELDSREICQSLIDFVLSNVNIYIHIYICAVCVRVCVQRAEN